MGRSAVLVHVGLRTAPTTDWRQVMERDGSAELSSLLTMIITTSPSPVHPSCELILQVIDSMEHHAPALSACRTIIVCDGCNVHGRCKYRSGMVDAAALERYIEYKRRLRSALAARPPTGPEAAEQPPATQMLRCEPRPVPPNIDPSVGDWACPHCGNWNWRRRDECNQCHEPPEPSPPIRVGEGSRFELLEL